MKTAVNTIIFQLKFLLALLAVSRCFWKFCQTLIRPVNKLVLVVSRCHSDAYMKEIILLHAIRLSESINLSVMHLIKLCLLQMWSGIKYDKVRLNFNDLARDARHLKRYVLVNHSLFFVHSKVVLLFDPVRFLSFLCKTKLSCEFNMVLSILSLVLSCLHGKWFFPRWNLRKTKISLFRLGLDAIAIVVEMRLFKCFRPSLQWYIVNRNNCFLTNVFVLCWHKVFSFIAIPVPVCQRDTIRKLRDHQFVCRLHRLFSCLLRRRKKNTPLSKIP